MIFRARVENGQIDLHERTDLPDGDVALQVVDDDDLTSEEREALHRTLAASRRSANEGRTRPGSAILNELRNQR